MRYAIYSQLVMDESWVPKWEYALKCLEFFAPGVGYFLSKQTQSSLNRSLKFLKFVYNREYPKVCVNLQTDVR